MSPRQILQIIVGVVALVSCSAGQTPSAIQPAKSATPPAVTLRVAAVQMRSQSELRANVAMIKKHLADLAARQVQIVAFPECAVSSYAAPVILGLAAADLAAAEVEIAAACREHAIAAIVGIPERRAGKLYNCALIINPRGEIVARYDKAQLVGQDLAWQCVPGAAVSPVFGVGATEASVIICHDSRYPELCRLPVMAGARVVFYISHESTISKENKMGPYRAQVQARAVENSVFVVHANAPADGVRTGSHGQSRIVAPDGNILQEASQLQEEVLVADLDLKEATGERALASLKGPLGDWWRSGLKQVRVIK
ncbi:MAG: carbon-nitrogen hydrolase family protein [Opitutus sp.]|nr:carbon-nitrogen hydrolase family protein [Opitutus sp.]